MFGTEQDSVPFVFSSAAWLKYEKLKSKTTLILAKSVKENFKSVRILGEASSTVGQVDVFSRFSLERRLPRDGRFGRLGSRRPMYIELCLWSLAVKK